MFPPVYIAQIAQHEGKEVTLHGWLHNRRSSGKLHFLQVRDGTGTIQCVVFKGNVPPEVFQEADHLPQETSLTVTGLVKRDDRSPIGYELDVRGLAAVARPTAEFPIGHKEHGVAFLMEQRHLWLRSPRQQVILRVRHSVEKAIRDFFDERGFTLVELMVVASSASLNVTTIAEFTETPVAPFAGDRETTVGAVVSGNGAVVNDDENAAVRELPATSFTPVDTPMV